MVVGGRLSVVEELVMVACPVDIVGRAMFPPVWMSHDPLHVGAPPVLRGHDAARRRHQSFRRHHLLHLFVKDGLLLLLLLVLWQLKTLLGHTDKDLSIKFLELLTDQLLVDGLCHVETLQAALLQGLDKG